TDLPVKDFMATYLALGVQQIFCTDVSKDGRMEGPSIELYTNLIESLPDLHLIASGGVSQLQDLVDLKA
ncbi:HisA/HisF-related TIM barrel protein, partial [Streptomyces sp. UMAF16]|nr:HisA/HisF-related TIM barrel protein [Streptomyces sp. UMAF16]